VDGRIGLIATEVTSLAGPTSRRSPVRAWSSRPSSLRGLRRPLSRARRVGPPPSSFEGEARRPYGSGQHSATGLSLAMPHSIA
jgi:hypothetical protein